MKIFSLTPDTDIESLRKEFRSLRLRAGKSIDSFNYIFGIVHSVLIVSVTSFVAVRTFDLGLTFLALFVSGYIPGIIASTIVSGFLDYVIGNRFKDYLESRRMSSSWYQRYQYLKTFVPEYEQKEKFRLAEEERIQIQKLAEEKRIRLKPVNDEIQRISDEIRKIEATIEAAENAIWRKRKWYSEYRKHESSTEKCLRQLEEFKNQGQSAKETFGVLAEENSYQFLILFSTISDLKRRCTSTLAKMKNMKDWIPSTQISKPSNSVTASTREPLNFVDNSSSLHRTILNSGDSFTNDGEQPVDASRKPQPASGTQRIGQNSTFPPSWTSTRENSNEQVKQSGISKIEPSFKIPAFDEDDATNSQIKQPLIVPMPQPPVKRGLSKQLTQIPFKDYAGAADAKMEVGEMGEIIVLHYELKRVREETGLSSLGNVIRVSEKSNGLGYDIESFSDDDKVFIEVKSTTGGFWQDFFLSENERRVMNFLGEKYWLYRIFDLSKENGSAKLSIFRGKKEIEATFELEATNYKFVAKSKINENGTLPFETL